jgi:hypothetical protein
MRTTRRLSAVGALLGLAGLVHAGPVSTADIAKDPNKYEGSNVTVKAEVDKVYDGRAFTLDADAAVEGPDVLVLIPNAATVVSEDDVVTVTGVVRPFVQSEIQRDYTWFKPQEDVIVALKSRPVIVASSVLNRDGKELVPPPSERSPNPAPAVVVPPVETGKSNPPSSPPER